MNSTAVKIATYVLLGIAAVVMLFPFFYMFATACKSESQLVSARLLPRPWHLENFPTAWTKEPFTRFLFNSIGVAVAVTLATLLLSSMGGFAFAKFDFRGKNLAFMAFIATLMIPMHVTMIPNFKICAYLRLVNTYGGLILPVLPLAFGIFLMRQFMFSVPNSLVEAARIDGSSDARVFLQIMLPLCKPALATLAIFTFMANWNNFLWPLIILDSEYLYTLPIGLMRFSEQYDVQYHYTMAVSLLSIVPIVILFLFFQRAFVKGMALTGLKG
jgi:ABC-type glycerol-3-phosphate transport system permease component